MGEEIFEPKQIAFLEIIKNCVLTEHFYLTGGTALAGFYLYHRKSEDLDFFSEEEIDPMVIDVFLKSQKNVLGFSEFEFQKSFNRNLFFLHYPDGILKTEFTYFPFPPLEKGMRHGQLRIDSMRDIATNKVFAVLQQLRARDFVDLFFILKKEKWALPDLLKDARIKFDTHIDLIQFGSQLLRVGEAKDLPRMTVPLDQEELESFFIDAAASMRDDIFE